MIVVFPDHTRLLFLIRNPIVLRFSRKGGSDPLPPFGSAHVWVLTMESNVLFQESNCLVYFLNYIIYVGVPS